MSKKNKEDNNLEMIDLNNFDELREEEENNRIETLKEAIAPSSFSRGATDYITSSGFYARTFYLEGFPDTVGIGYLTELFDSDYDVDVSFSINPRQQSNARKELQDKLTIAKAQYEEEVESGANRNRDTYLEQIRKLEAQISELASKEELAFEAQLFFTLYAKNKEELERNTSLLVQSLKDSDLTAQVFSLRQDSAWKSVIPYGIDYVGDKKRNFNTGAVISSIPFYIPELYDEYGVFLGDNSFNGSPALIDLYKDGIQNSNLNIFGASGSGKSTLVKILTMRSSLHGIKTVIIDPEGEYDDVTRKLHGSTIRLTMDIENSVMMNIFDVEESNVIEANGSKKKYLDLRTKYEDVLGFIKVAYPEISKGQEANTLEVIEELYKRFGFIDGDVESLYLNDDYIVIDNELHTNSYKKTMPRLSDFLDLMNIFVKNGTYYNLKDVYDALQPYRYDKSRGLFDTHTPKDLEYLTQAPVINFDISGLESGEIRGVSMYVLLSWIWEKFGKKNPEVKKRILVDEAWMMMSSSMKGSEFTSDFLETMSRRIRKRNGALVIATQKIEDFAGSQKGSAIISNAHTTFLLSHEISDKPVIQKEFGLDGGIVDNIIESQKGRILIKQASQLYLVDVVMFENERKLLTNNFK